MFTTLLETRAAHTRTWRGHSLSTLVHGAAIALAVLATHDVTGAGPADEERVQFRVSFTPPPPVPPPSATAAPLRSAPPIAKGFQVLVAPIDIPDVLPPIDLSAPVTNAADFTGRHGVAGGASDGVAGAAPRPLGGDVTYFSHQVEKVAALMPGTGVPAYPDALQHAGIDGTVRVTFVIDSLGRADMRTVRVLEATHALFAEAVKRALVRARFFPAEVGGRAVRQNVEMPFLFSLGRR